MKYRKKPIVIEADQFHREGNIPKGVYPQFEESRNTLYLIETRQGVLRVSEGDWIITGIEGERYPCKDSVFKATYEAV